MDLSVQNSRGSVPGLSERGAELSLTPSMAPPQTLPKLQTDPNLYFINAILDSCVSLNVHTRQHTLKLTMRFLSPSFYMEILHLYIQEHKRPSNVCFYFKKCTGKFTNRNYEKGFGLSSQKER